MKKCTQLPPPGRQREAFPLVLYAEGLVFKTRRHVRPPGRQVGRPNADMIGELRASVTVLRIGFERPRPVGLAAALLLAAAFSACSPRPPAGFGRLHLCTSDEGPADAYCGTLSVFENRQAHTGRRLSLAIVVLPALSDEYRLDPLVFLAGGPGQGAAAMAPLVHSVFSRVQQHRDIVLVDQRGTGHSNPLDCRDDEETLQSAFADDNRVIRQLQTCLHGYDADVRLYTTPIAMDDLDDVRGFLGFSRVNLYGGSYGTRAALVYVRQHPDRVRSIVLDGVAPTDMRLPLFAARDASRALGKLLDDCEGEPRCRAAYPSLRQQVTSLLTRLDNAPAHVTLTHPRTGRPERVTVTARAVASAVLDALYSPATAAMLPLLLDRAVHDDFQGLLALALAGDQSENLSVGMQLSVLCSEDAGRIDPDDVTHATSSTLFGRHLIAGQMAACGVWPKGELPANYAEPVVSDVPALILSGDLDPVTPPSWGEAVTSHLRNGRHFVASGTGHGVVTTPCGARVIADFFEHGTADGLDTRCLTEPARPPFFLTPSGPDPTARSRVPR
jgi:pimeloyl-ACP methyl ester carboxylesterase